MKEAGDLRIQLAAVLTTLRQTRAHLTIAELERDKLLYEKILLCKELRDLRNHLAFLKGQDGLGHQPWDIRRIFG